MTIPTVAVTVRLADLATGPLAGYTVTATLDKDDRYGEFLVASSVSGVTNSLGVVVLQCFPNHPTTGLGTTGSVYTFTCKALSFRCTAQVPNSACELHTIADLAMGTVLDAIFSRSNHTGTQLAATISDFAATVRATVLTGIDLVTSGTVTAADTVLTAVGKLWVKIVAHIADTGNPHGVTKTQVGLPLADNTSDANKPVSTAQQTALDLKAPLASPALTGAPTAPTAAAGTNTTQLATTAHVLAERTNAATLTNKTLTSPVINTPTGIVKGDVGLGSVDNTSDLAKPVSTAQQAALNLKTTSATLAASSGSALVGFSHAASNTAGTVGAKLAKRVYVTDAPYNAVGDGSANDTAAVHAARDALGTGILCFPPGTFKGNFVFGTGIRVMGAGRGKTIFKAQSAASPIIHFTDAVTSTYFYTGGEEFSVNGEGTAAIGIKVGTGSPGLGTVTYGGLRNVFVDYCTDNIYVKDAIGFSMDGVRSYRALASALKIDENDIVTMLDVRNSQFAQAVTGLSLLGGALVQFSCCVIESNKNIGAHISRVTASGARQVRFSTCWFEDNAHTPTTGAASGLFIDVNSTPGEYPNYVTFENCVMSSNGTTRNVCLWRGEGILFDRCTFDALTATRLYAETGNGYNYALLRNCGTIAARPSPTVYTSFPALVSTGSGAQQQGFRYQYEFQGLTYTNQPQHGFYWYVITSATGLAATGNGAEYTTATMAGVSSTTELYDVGANFASGAFTAPEAGRYSFKVVWPISAFTTAMTSAEVAFIVNPAGTPARYQVARRKIVTYGAADIESYEGTITLDLAKTDVVVASIKISGGAGATAEIYRNVTAPGLFAFSGRREK